MVKGLFGAVVKIMGPFLGTLLRFRVWGSGFRD